MITAIIAEFNPLTNGHKHIISEAKKNGDTVLCLMSGNFVQRGEGAILPKHVRAKMAVMAGADIVCELPVHFSCSNAETFAFGAMKLLSQIPNVKRVLFGSECGDIIKLKTQAGFSENEEFKKALSLNLEGGTTFAKAVSETHAECGGAFSASPNDVLGVEYIKAGNKLGFCGAFETIPRLGVSHDSLEESEGFASASLIRELLKDGKREEIARLVPSEVLDVLMSARVVDCSSLGVLASYQGIFGADRDEISEACEGLENLMYQRGFEGFSDYAMAIKSKRYTLAKIKRMSVKSVLNITKDDVKFAKKHIGFLRVLAVSKASVGIFSEDFGLKLIVRGKDAEGLSRKQHKIYEQMEKADLVYSLFSHDMQYKMEVCD